MNREIPKIAQQIEKVIDAIKTEGKRSEGLIEAKAESMRAYDKAVATASIRLKSEGLAATLIDKQAKGEAAQYLYEMTAAVETLKAHWHRLEYLKAQLNGYQSIFRHLESTGK